MRGKKRLPPGRSLPELTSHRTMLNLLAGQQSCQAYRHTLRDAEKIIKISGVAVFFVVRAYDVSPCSTMVLHRFVSQVRSIVPVPVALS